MWGKTPSYSGKRAVCYNMMIKATNWEVRLQYSGEIDY